MRPPVIFYKRCWKTAFNKLGGRWITFSKQQKGFEGLSICKDQILIHVWLRSEASLPRPPVCGAPPRCKSFVPGAQHGSHFRLIVGTDGTSGVATPKLLAARLPRLCRPRKCLQTLPLQSWRPDFVGRKMRRKRGEEEEGRGERERRGRGNAKT